MSKTFDIETVVGHDITDEQLRAEAILHDAAFPDRNTTIDDIIDQHAALFRCEARNLKQPQLLIIRDNSRFIAKAGIASRTISTQRGDITVLALFSVAVDPNHRGKKLGAAIVQRAFDRVDGKTYGCSLFQTDVPGFYEKLNARQCDNPFVDGTANIPQGRPWWSEYVMVYPANFDWPSGKIDLNGPGY